MENLIKLSMNDNNVSSLDGLADKCPMLMELSLSGMIKFLRVLRYLTPQLYGNGAAYEALTALRNYTKLFHT